MRSRIFYNALCFYALSFCRRQINAFQQIVPFGASLRQPSYIDRCSTPLSSTELVSIPITSTLPRVDTKEAEETIDGGTKRSALFHAVEDVATTSIPTPDTAQPKNERIHLRIDRLKRSLVVMSVCVGTSMLVKYGGLSIIQASSVQAIIASFIFSGQPTVGAALCGSFAGMSGQLSSLFDASVLGILCGISYYLFESKQKLAVGYGGRLGTIAFLANLVDSMIMNPSGFLSVEQNTVKRISPLVLVSILTIFAVYRNCFEKLKIETSEKKEMLNYVQRGAQVILFGLFAGRLIQIANKSGKLCYYSCFDVHSKSCFFKLPGIVLPVGIIGLLS